LSFDSWAQKFSVLDVTY